MASSEAPSRRHTRLTSHWLSIEESLALDARNSNADAERPLPGARRDAGGRDTEQPADDAPVPAEAPAGTTLSDRKKEFRIITFILTPTILSTFVLLGLFWRKESACGAPLREWCLVEALRLTLSIFISGLLQRDVDRPAHELRRLDRIGRVLGVFSFCWFVLGHFWLVSAAHTCTQSAPHLLRLAFALIVLQYALMLLPLIVLVVLTPFLCLCLPCIVQGFIWFNQPAVKGATRREINRLPVEAFAAHDFAERGFDSQCAICLADFDKGDAIRLLRCRHVFHKACVDSWLTLNRTCPICRAPIAQQRAKKQPSAAAGSAADGNGAAASIAAAPAADVAAGSDASAGAATSAAAREGSGATQGFHSSTSTTDSSASNAAAAATASAAGQHLCIELPAPPSGGWHRDRSVSDAATAATAPAAPAIPHTRRRAASPPPPPPALPTPAPHEDAALAARTGNALSNTGGVLMGPRPLSLRTSLLRSWGLASRARAAERRALSAARRNSRSSGLSALGLDDDDDDDVDADDDDIDLEAPAAAPAAVEPPARVSPAGAQRQQQSASPRAQDAARSRNSSSNNGAALTRM